MRYRRLGCRYASMATSRALGPADWRAEWLVVTVTETRWQPQTDVYETADALDVTVELAGIEPEDIEVQLFEDALVIEGERQLPRREEGGVYRAARIRQGPFRVAVPLPASVDAERVDAREHHGLFHVRLPKRRGT